jgi:hypothetical protein
VGNDYRRVLFAGGMDAGRFWRFGHLEHHTILVNRRSGAHAIWSQRYRPDGSVNPEFALSSPDVYEVPAHPIAYPALLAGLIAPFHPAIEDVERDAGLVMVLIGWLTGLVTFLVARRSGMSRARSVLCVVVLALASPWLPYARSYYSEPAIGLCMIFSLWAIEEEHFALAAFTAAAAAILKPPFAVIGAGFVLESLWDRRGREAILMAAILATCAVATMAFNYWLARTFIISGNIVPFGPNFGPGGPSHFRLPLYDILLGPEHGVLVFAPWVIFSVFGFGHAFRNFGERSSLTRHMAIPTILYLATIVFAGFGPGTCYGPRYLVPLLPWFALAAVGWLTNRPLATRAAFVFAVTLGALIAILGILRYPDMFA